MATAHVGFFQATLFGKTAKRTAAWAFEKLDTLHHRIIQRAGCLVRPQGKQTLTMSANLDGSKRFIALPRCYVKSRIG